MPSFFFYLFLFLFVTFTSRANPRNSNRFSVERLDYKVSLKKYNPEIVIVSWMSKDLDMTPDFRAKQGVQEYILIGEVDYGACGSLETWGANIQGAPRWEEEGFGRLDLEDLSALQIARTDSPYVRFHSKTVSFRRVEAKKT